MKTFKILILLFAFFLYSCGVGTYSVSAGKEDESYVCVVSPKSIEVVVSVDGTNYNVKTIKQINYKKRRNIKQTATTHIVIPVGTHELVVSQNGKTLYSKKIFVSSQETKIIEL